MLIHNNFRSWCLNTNTDVDIIIPDPAQNTDVKQFYEEKRNFPVLWLLHGTWGGYNDFVRRTNIDMYAKECGLMVVMPNALNSDYSNWPDFMLGYNMFDFLTEELMPMVQNWLPASKEKKDNYIGGISMGSIGAIKYAINHPDRFAGCAAMSGTPRDVERLYKENRLDNRTLFSIQQAGGIEKWLSSYENLWDNFIEVATKKDSPLFYFSCGKDDFLYDSYKEFENHVSNQGCHVLFRESEGYGHEWRLWELEIQRSLEVFGFKAIRNITKSTIDKVDATNL